MQFIIIKAFKLLPRKGNLEITSFQMNGLIAIYPCNFKNRFANLKLWPKLNIKQPDISSNLTTKDEKVLTVVRKSLKANFFKGGSDAAS